jgi:hypothetical protein
MNQTLNEMKKKLVKSKREEWQDIGLDGNIADEMAWEEVEDLTNEEIRIDIEDLEE